MALANYSDLKSSVADWLVRSDLTAVIPDFIALAEAQMERVLRCRQMVVRTNLTVTSEYTALPADFLEMWRVKESGEYALEFNTSESIDAMYDAGGDPRYYTIVGSELRLFPSPQASTVYEITYFGKLSKLSNTNTTNWLLTQAPDAYVYGALLQAAPYLQDDARIPVWQGLYQSAIEALRIADEAGQHTQGILKVRSRPFGG